MIDLLKALVKQPYWVIALILGGGLVVLPCVTTDSGHWVTHSPNPPILLIIGCTILVASAIGFGFSLSTKRPIEADGLDLSSVTEGGGVLSTKVSGCAIRVIEGRIEEYVQDPGSAIALPCNEYFDDLCARDSRSALGAYVTRVFGEQATAFVSLMRSESKKKFGVGTPQQKTDTETAESFGAGRCLLLINPLGRPGPVALISTTTQRAGTGLSAQISCLFEGMHKLTGCLADERITEVAMPLLGGGHGGIHPSLALIGLVLAIAEAARYGQGAQRLKRVTIINFKKDS
jgi:hypothetical protein